MHRPICVSSGKYSGFELTLLCGPHLSLDSRKGAPTRVRNGTLSHFGSKIAKPCVSCRGEKWALAPNRRSIASADVFAERKPNCGASMILAKLPSSPTSFGKNFPVRLLRRNGVPGEPSGLAPPSRPDRFLALGNEHACSRHPSYPHAGHRHGRGAGTAGQHRIVNPTANAADVWQPKTPPLSTRWTPLVGPNNALPEYPRPQLSRPKWLNLNGLWGYTGRPAKGAATGQPAENDYREQILVPFPTESALSGIQRHDDQMWYRKVFQIPDDWDNQHVLLHFGAVDQIATVWVNNKQVARHEGGYTEFSADITSALRTSGPQELTVRVEDRNENGGFAVGKQRYNPAGLFYTGASGIWQTVWMEPVAKSYIDKLDVTPDLTSFTVTPRVSGATDQRTEVVVSKPGGQVVARASGKPGAALRLQVPSAHLWTPDDPYLYDLTARLVSRSGEVVDEVSSYGGLRTISKVKDAQGRSRIALNGKITFLHGPLDQGYWPDGIYTAPTDEALKFDLEQIKALGMNFVRKHAKVEPARWYYWTDKLGTPGVAGHAVAGGVARHPDRSGSDAASASPGAFRERTLGNGPSAEQRHVDRRLGAVQRGLGRVRHGQGRQSGQGRGPNPHGGPQQWGELLQVPW